jgi:hypothetical protein
MLLDYGSTIREPVGPIHWAGAEASTFWMDLWKELFAPENARHLRCLAVLVDWRTS